MNLEKYINKIIQGDALSVLKTLPDESVDMCMTSPPYWALRDYGVEGQLGLEPTFQEYINKLCDIFDEVKRVLKNEGTCWVNLGDTYSMAHTGGRKSKKSTVGANKPEAQEFKQTKVTNLKDKCLCQIPARFSIEMTDYYGWILRNEIIWHKNNGMPSSVDDRFTVDFEKVFFYAKNKKYYFKQQLEAYTKPMDRWGGEKVKAYKGKFTQIENIENYNSPRARQLRPNYPERNRDMRPNKNGKNKRCVWTINTKPYPEAHFAVYPEKLCQTPIKAGCPAGGIVLDPFMGAGTTALTALKLRRKFIGIELNPEYIKIAEKRIWQEKNQLKLL